MSNENKEVQMTVKQARLIPGWLTAIALAIVVVMIVSIVDLGLVWMTYLLGGLCLALVFLSVRIFNEFAVYYNHQQIKNLLSEDNLMDVFRKLNGTFQDETCLTKEHDDEETGAD